VAGEPAEVGLGLQAVECGTVVLIRRNGATSVRRQPLSRAVWPDIPCLDPCATVVVVACFVVTEFKSIHVYLLVIRRGFGQQILALLRTDLDQTIRTEAGNGADEAHDRVGITEGHYGEPTPVMRLDDATR